MTTKKVGYVYAIENNFDTSIYIGLTTKTIKERFAQHLQSARSQRASCILHLFMAKHGPENFTIRELRKVEYNSIIELHLVEEECIKDFGDLNTVYNSRSYEMAGLSLNRIVKERKGKERPVVVSKVPKKEDAMEIACEAEEYPNNKISLSSFIDLFIPQTENYGKILDDLTSESGKIHVSPTVLEWFGYEGEIKEQKKAFIKMLRRNEIEYHQLNQKDKEIEYYPSIKTEIAKMPSCDAVKSKFLIMEPNAIKMAIMQLKTKNGHTIRQYYIDLEELLKLYTEYTLYFNHRESQRKITNLEQMMADMKLERQQDRELIQQQTKYMKSLGISLEEVKDQNDELLDNNRGLKREVKKVQYKLGIAVEDRAPQPEDESKRERFVLIKRNDPEYYPYYTIRAQEGYTTRKLKFEKTNFPNLEVLLDFKCNPNSKTLFNRIKENLKATGVTFRGNNIDLEESNISEDKLVDEMKAVNNSKRDV
ncbi:hypothetical protein IIV25_091R [Invertebrate iridovirus 25]|uniref:GIY-YIG domain-containing protein n=1 Tax=Invertebrate iridovirus 25 TaxID=1301280 RepID=W8W2T7_9VIRU|nr:hypothetical protein IIV25_091R [Invertebrate iridovirus 25]CCV02109.1 hypothetical protein IIV25_091R [Invertebrate iridovirus 25]